MTTTTPSDGAIERAAPAQQAPEAVPVARVLSWTNGSRWRNYTLEWLQDVPAGAALYAAPVAQPAPAVVQQGGESPKPDGKLHADGYFTWHRRDGYVLDRRLPCDFYLAPAAHAQQPAQPAALTDAQIGRLFNGPGLSPSDRFKLHAALFARIVRLVEGAHGIAATPAPTTNTGEKR